MLDRRVTPAAPGSVGRLEPENQLSRMVGVGRLIVTGPLTCVHNGMVIDSPPCWVAIGNQWY
jgi:hypothetical protein